MLNNKNIKSILFCTVYLLSQVVTADPINNNRSNDNYIQLQTASKNTFVAYAVGPKNAKQGILLIHGWWGLTREVEAWANQFAVKGYRVIAVDLYDKQVTKNPEAAKKLMLNVKQSVANEKYVATIKILSENGRKVAIIGRSFGASQTLHAALAGEDKIDAAIVYYPFGKLMTDKKSLSLIKAPILTHFASDDFFLTPEKRKNFISSIKASGLPVTVNVYKARHGFDNPTSNNFNEVPHTLSLNRTNQFLNKYLN